MTWKGLAAGDELAVLTIAPRRQRDAGRQGERANAEAAIPMIGWQNFGIDIDATTGTIAAQQVQPYHNETYTH